MRKNYTMTRGDTKVIEEVLNLDGLPLDLLTAAITFTVGDLFSKTVDNGIELVPPDSGTDVGEVTITIDPADTVDCPDYRTVYHYDVQVVDDGVVSTPLYGELTVLADVTV